MQSPNQSLPNQDIALRQQIISRQDINRQYKQNVSLIYQTLTDLVDFSNELGDKVDSLLQHQSVGFFNAYRSHLTTIQQNVSLLENKILAQEAKIKEYQSEGTIALLLKKIAKIEKELNNLYEIRVKLMGQLQEEKIKNGVLRTENVKLGENIQQLMRRKSPQRWNTNPDYELKRQSIPLQRNTQPRNKTKLPTTELNRSVSIKDKRLSFNDAFVKDLADIEVKILKNKITHLTKEHNKLLKNSVEIGQLHSELEGFFLECVESVKREICVRKQIPVCKLAEFKKEDKRRVLEMVLQNDEIVRTVYGKLFKNANGGGGVGRKGMFSQQSVEKQDAEVVFNNKGSSLSKSKKESKSTALPNLKTRKIDRSLQSH